jgi:hypothetical protein
MAYGRIACGQTTDSGRWSLFRFHFAVHLRGVGESGPNENTHAARRASLPCLRFFLIAFAGSSLRSYITGRLSNVGIRAVESFSCRRLERQLTSNAILRANNVACFLLTRVVRMMRGPRNLPSIDGMREKYPSLGEGLRIWVPQESRTGNCASEAACKCLILWW